MAALSDADRIAIWAAYMSSETGTFSLTKHELKAAFDAADDWVNSNAAAFNSAIPQPARGALSASQKARLLMAVVAKRFEKGA